MILCVGDEFALQSLANVNNEIGFVTANVAAGSLHADMGPDVETARPARPLFSRMQMQIAEQYAASKKLAKFGETLGGDPRMRKKLAAAADAESEMNQDASDMAVGQNVIFGAVYQVRSPTAGRNIQVTKTIADEDATALKCVLAEEGQRSKGLWFRIRPGLPPAARCSPRMRSAGRLMNRALSRRFSHPQRE